MAGWQSGCRARHALSNARGWRRPPGETASGRLAGGRMRVMPEPGAQRWPRMVRGSVVTHRRRCASRTVGAPPARSCTSRRCSATPRPAGPGSSCCRPAKWRRCEPRWSATDGRALLRRLLADHLELRAHREARVEVVDAAGVARGRVESGHGRALATVFGEVEVHRLAYRAPGQANLHPADGGLNLPEEKHSHGLRRLAAVEAARGSFDEAAGAVERATGDRLGKRQVAELAARTAVDFDDFYATRKLPPAADPGDVLALSADGKGIVMRPEALRPATARAAAKTSPKAGDPAVQGREAQPQPHGRTGRRLRRGTRRAHPGRHPCGRRRPV